MNERKICTVCGAKERVRLNICDDGGVFPCGECGRLVCQWHAGMRLCCKEKQRESEFVNKRTYKL